MKRNLMKFALAVAALCCSLATSAQGVEIVGKVIDEIGETLPGVNVMIKGQSKGTITNIDGIYKIQINNPQSTTLVFSYVGMTPLEEKVGSRKTINATLKNSSIALNEVVAVGYANMKRKDLTGSVVSVNASEISKVPVSNVAQALAGRMSGVSVTQSEGDPNNSSISIRVRGGISLTQDNEPLYIIDGFPSDASLFQTLNPSDIETIDVLKDASSTAIYGARGANGVVVITTKSGVEGKISVSYEGYVGVKNINKKLDMLSIPEFTLLNYERSYEGVNADGTPKANGTHLRRYGSFEEMQSLTNPGLNWQDEFFNKNAFFHSHKVNLTGGTKDMKYNLSYQRQEDNAVLLDGKNIKDNIRAKFETRINKRARVSANINYTGQLNDGISVSENGYGFSKTNQLLTFIPTLGKILADDILVSIPSLGDYDPSLVDVDGESFINPAVSARAEKRVKDIKSFSANAGFQYEFIKGLTFKNSTGMLFRTQREEVYNGKDSNSGRRSSINGSLRNYESGSFQTSNTLSYDFREKSHKFSFLLGQEYISRWDRWFRTSVTNLPNDDMYLHNLKSGTASPSESQFNDDDKLLSFFGRGYWNLKERYMLTVTARLDGSSKFGKNNKWGFFPSASFAWRASEEEFIKQLGVFSDLKLRVGYGTSGNNRIPSYSSLAQWGSQNAPSNNGTIPGYYPERMPNEDLRWESNATFNTGLDIGFFDQRLTISPEFYINRSMDLLLNAAIPGSSGHTKTIRNIGSVENTGVDLTINSINIQNKNFSWSTALTLSHNRNKIIALSGEQSYTVESGFGYKINDYIVEVGQPVGQMYGFKTEGLYQVSDFQINEQGAFITTLDASGKAQYKLKDGIAYPKGSYPRPGDWKYSNKSETTELDTNGNPLITDEDRQVIGCSQPIIYGGLNNTFTYRDFDLSIFFNYSIGGNIFNATRLGSSLYGSNNTTTLASNGSQNRWMTVDEKGLYITDPAKMAQVNEGKTLPRWSYMGVNNKEIHSWAVEDASFLRLSNVTIGYNLPKKVLSKIKLASLRFYATGNNLLCFSNYSGYDPEVSTRNQTGLTPGVDWSSFPKQSSFVFGINVGF